MECRKLGANGSCSVTVTVMDTANIIPTVMGVTVAFAYMILESAPTVTVVMRIDLDSPKCTICDGPVEHKIEM